MLIFLKINISYTLIRTHACMYQGDRNVFFLENFHERTKWLTTELINSNELFIFNARCIQRQLFALQLANHIFFQFFSHL